MTARLRELAEKNILLSTYGACNERDLGRHEGRDALARELLAILDAQGDGGAVAGYVDPEQVADLERTGGAVQIGTFSERYHRTVPVYWHPHPARSGGVSDADVDLAVLAHHTWCKDAGFTGYVTCRGAIRAALEHFAKGSHMDAEDAARYRWIVSNDGRTGSNEHIQRMWENCKTAFPSVVEWNAAIDAARKGELL